jgi:hypothetical protein
MWASYRTVPEIDFMGIDFKVMAAVAATHLDI